MSRSNLIFKTLLLLLLFLFRFLSSTAQNTNTPNILWIVTEDNSKHYLRLSEERLVKVRAIEFLILNDQAVDNDVIIALLKSANTETEANLMLNSIALLKAVRPNFRIHLPKEIFDSNWVAKPDNLVNRRVEFINE